MQVRRCCRRALAAAALPIALLWSAARAQEAPDLEDDATLGEFLRVAELRNPRLEADRRLWLAETEAAHAAGSFPDPQVSFAWYLEEVETRVGPQTERLSLRQRLPWFGKLALRSEMAGERAEAALARYDDRRIKLRRDVTLAWLDLYWLGRATALTEENLDLLIKLERVIRERYRLGRVAHADLIRVQVEMGVVENHFRSLRDRLRPATARMNALLHRGEDAPLPIPRKMPPWPGAPGAATTFESVRRGSHRLREHEQRIAQADAGRRLAHRARWPDWLLGADWIRTGDALDPSLPESGKDPFVLTLSVEIPVFRGKWDAPARAAEERLAAARAGRDFEEDELIAQADEVLFDWRDADRRLDLYGSALLPKARESYVALDTAYRTGRGAFLDLIEAQRTLLEFELERERAQTDRGRAAAKLDYLMGETRERWESQ